MSNSLKIRILDALVVALCSFIIFAIIYKEFLIKENWFSFSIIWSISWAVGRFVSKSIDTLEKSIWFNIFSYMLIVVILFFLEAFIFGVLFPIIQWKYILSITIIPFGLSLIFN